MGSILVITNSIDGLYFFRKELLHKLNQERNAVTIAAPAGGKTSAFIQMGYTCIITDFKRTGTNPLAEFRLLRNYLKILRRLKPDLVLTYTIKPNIYGGIACRLLGVPYIGNITGLGISIENGGLLRTIALAMYRIGLKKASCVFFQNETNRQFFLDNKLVKVKTRLIPGSGVNLNEHRFEEYPGPDEDIRFLFFGRIMRAKGLEELLEAAVKIKGRYPEVHFDILGSPEEDIPAVKELQAKGIINYHGFQDHVHSYIKHSHATINPSHHEGMSNVLLESAATGRPVLASRIPGCSEAFDEGISGLGFTARDSGSLYDTIVKFIELPYETKKKMGIAGRAKMEREFDRALVTGAYFDEINTIMRKRR